MPWGDEPAPDVVYLKALHEAETGIAMRLGAILTIPAPPVEIDPDKIASEVVRKLAIEPSDMQLHVLTDILSHRAAIITGGPGTGKTTLIRSICAVFETLGRRISLAAPTGRAARRLSEVTRRKASTIHKLLGCRLEDGQFEKKPGQSPRYRCAHHRRSLHGGCSAHEQPDPGGPHGRRSGAGWGMCSNCRPWGPAMCFRI